MPYNWGFAHRHVPEIEQALGLNDQLLFYPVKATWARGIEVEIQAQVHFPIDIFRLYEEFYAGEKFVRIRTEAKKENVKDTNFCDIYPTADDLSVKIYATLDNLIKGAAGQAVQNMNIICSLPEDHGLK